MGIRFKPFLFILPFVFPILLGAWAQDVPGDTPTTVLPYIQHLIDRATSQLENQKLHEAAESLTQALEISRRDVASTTPASYHSAIANSFAITYNRIGQTHQAAGNQDTDAAKSYATALALLPEHPEASLRLGALLKEHGERMLTSVPELREGWRELESLGESDSLRITKGRRRDPNPYPNPYPNPTTLTLQP